MEPSDTRAAAAETGRKSSPGEPIVTLDGAREISRRLRARLQAAVLGREEVVELMIVALLADGHVLLEDYPGSGKTTLAKALGDTILDDLPEDDIPSFRRIQFTPDLLPSDVTGVSVFDGATSRFHFRRGPIFAYVVLADEINRTSPKVQAAMLEAMAEKQVTVDNITHRLDDLFFVIATQNPLDLAGTYPLPVAQLDRFLFKIRMQHISRDAELEVLSTWQERMAGPPPDMPPVTRSQVLGARLVTQKTVVLAPPIRECLVDVARALRADKRVLQGASTRSLVLALPALQARAVLHGRDFASAEDIAVLAPRIFGHRIELAPGFDETDTVITECAAGPLERLARASLGR